MNFNEETMDAIRNARNILDSLRDNEMRLAQVEEMLKQRGVQKKTGKTERERKKMFLTLFKLANGCAICGVNDDPICLDLDHIDRGTKRHSIGDLPKQSWKTLINELVKCQVLCAICHRLKTESERISIKIQPSTIYN
jgi:hypothetical protein